jgi:hypothetical protein
VLEKVESFTNLGSIVDKQGGTDADVMISIGEAGRFPAAKRYRHPYNLSTNTKCRLFNTNNVNFLCKQILRISLATEESVNILFHFTIIYQIEKILI